MKHPDKWRDTCDPFSLPYHCFEPLEILGYPHAGNDVFHVRGLYCKKDITAYIKVARQTSAAIQNEVTILSQLHSPITPTVVDYGFDDIPFSVTLELPGKRLSAILGEHEHMDSLTYLPEYGAALAKIHLMNLSSKDVVDRRFFHTPSFEMLEKTDLVFLKDYFSNPPEQKERCFVHGDFHYANILWQGRHIRGILDFEMAGYGNRDFDIAWAIFLRPGQRFLKTEVEQEAFLKGYAEYGDCDLDAVRYYMAQCYVYFLQFSKEDREYCDYIRAWLRRTAG